MNTFNFYKMRCKKMHWMEEAVWEWYTPLVDAFNQLLPKHAVGGPEFAFMQTNFGNNKNEQCQQGPPN